MRALIGIIALQFVVIIVLATMLLTAEDESQDLPNDSATNTDVAERSAGTPRRRDEKYVRADRALEESKAQPGNEMPEPFDETFGTLLYGRVTTSDGKALERENLRLTKAGVSINDYGKVIIANIAADGSFASSSLKPAVWNVSCKVRGYLEFKKDLDLTKPGVRRLDIVLQRAVVLSVKIVTLDGRPIAEILSKQRVAGLGSLIVVASETPPAGDFPMTAMRGHARLGLGQWRPKRTSFSEESIGPEYAGSIEMKVPLPICLSLVLRHVVLETKTVPAGAEEVEFVVSLIQVKSKLSTLKAKFVDATSGEPLGGTSVSINDRQSRTRGKSANDDGVFLQESLRPGLMTMSIFSAGRERIDEYIRLEPGKTLNLGTIRLHQSVSIKGKVIDAKGIPVKCNFQVRNLDRIRFDQPLGMGMRRVSEADGNFEIPGVGPGRYLVQAMKKGFALKTTVVTVGADGVEGLVLVMEEGARVSIKAHLDPTDYPLLSIKDAAGNPVMARYIWGSWTLDYVLAPGDYTVTLHKDLELILSKTIKVGSQAMEIDLK